VGLKDKISDTVNDLTGDGDNADIPRRQPDGDPPVPPVEVPGPDLSAGAAPAGDVVTTEALRDLLEAPADAGLVVEDGHARVVADAAAADAVPILRQADLTTMLDGAGAGHGDEALDQLAAGLDKAVRQQGI
jgi:hypothetical protein